MPLQPGHPATILLFALVAAVLLRWHLWRAWLFIFPESIRIEQESPPDTDPVPAELELTHQKLKALGFTWLGTRAEHPRFGRRLVNHDYALPAQQCFATLYPGLAGLPRLYLLTPTKDSGFVLTANFRRPAREEKGRYLSGAIDGADPERLLNAHLRRVSEVGGPHGEWTMDGRIAAARAWFTGPGKLEVRQQNAVGLLWTLGALGMVGAAIFGRKG